IRDRIEPGPVALAQDRGRELHSPCYPLLVPVSRVRPRNDADSTCPAVTSVSMSCGIERHDNARRPTDRRLHARDLVRARQNANAIARLGLMLFLIENPLARPSASRATLGNTQASSCPKPRGAPPSGSFRNVANASIRRFPTCGPSQTDGTSLPL